MLPARLATVAALALVCAAPALAACGVRGIFVGADLLEPPRLVLLEVTPTTEGAP